MDLQFETSDKLTQELMNSTIKNEDPINFVYHLPGCDAHGMCFWLVKLKTCDIFFIKENTNDKAD